MKFLIIIPAHNEEQHILHCLLSLERQTYTHFELVIVNDGSTDRTAEIIHQFKEKSTLGPQILIVDLVKSTHEPGAKVVRTFNKGLELHDLQNFDVICKFDADIIFPENYLEKINAIYEKNTKAGMVSGIVKIRGNDIPEMDIFDFQNLNDEWKFENISSKNHVRGPIKSYRKQCFIDIQGLRPVLGWDNIDGMMAAKYHWEVVTDKTLWVKHLRPTAYQYRSQKAQKLGEYFYNIGLSFPLAIISAGKSSWKNRSLQEFLITIISFLKQNHPRTLSASEIDFVRKFRWSQILRKLKK